MHFHKRREKKRCNYLWDYSLQKDTWGVLQQLHRRSARCQQDAMGLLIDQNYFILPPTTPPAWVKIPGALQAQWRRSCVCVCMSCTMPAGPGPMLRVLAPARTQTAEQTMKRQPVVAGKAVQLLESSGHHTWNSKLWTGSVVFTLHCTTEKSFWYHPGK